MSFNSLKNIEYLAFLKKLSCPEVHLLAVAIFDEPLLHHFSKDYPSINSISPSNQSVFPLTQARQQALLTLNKQPETLLNFLQDERHRNLSDFRIGILYERLWHFFLLHDQSVNWVIANLAVRENGATLGEFDFIYHHKQQGLVHLEVAEKFYLSLASCSESDALKAHWQQCVGPEKQDTLYNKSHSLMHKQIKLLDYQAAQSTLLEKAIQFDTALSLSDIKTITKHIHIGGRVFFKNRFTQAIPGINPRHQHGVWLHKNALANFLAEKKPPHAIQLQRYQWIDPYQGSCQHSEHKPEEISDRCQMLKTRDKNSVNQQVIMLVPDQW